MVMGSDYTELDLMDVGRSGSDSEKVQTPDEAYRRRKVEEALEKAGLIETIRALPYGMDTYLGKMSREGAVDLSGGQNQRLVLARAIYRDAPIAILDEPTAALDPIAESEIYERYNQLVKGKTAIFISHRLASTRFCDRIFFIEDGQIIEEGSHEELMRYGGKYKEMFDIQAYYYQDHLEGDKLSVLSKDGGESR
ncbi:MAG TPA: ABC transporter ATP-binding protein, partial [Bacillota bacterium]|nr:ABC transporter ATP-binding protein [Bacillota bacterium]